MVATLVSMSTTTITDEQRANIVALAQKKLNDIPHSQFTELWFSYENYRVEVWWEYYCYYITVYWDSSTGVSQVCGLGQLRHTKQTR